MKSYSLVASEIFKKKDEELSLGHKSGKQDSMQDEITRPWVIQVWLMKANQVFN